MKVSDGQSETVLNFLGIHVEVCTAEVVPLILEGDAELADGTNFHILNLGEFDPTGEPISEELDVLLILCIHRVTRLPSF